MPADDLYWNPMDIESDESIPYPPKQYIDPWDLENYAYIRQHLDSVESDPSSLGETTDSAAFYYVPASKSTTLPSNKRQSLYAKKNEPKVEDVYGRVGKLGAGKYDTMITASENGTSNYVAIDEITMRNEALTLRRSRRKSQYMMEHIEEYDREMENIYETGFREQQKAMQIYTQEKPPPPRTKTGFIKNLLPKSKSPRNRRHSFTVGDYEHEQYRPSSNFPQYRTESPYPRPDYYDSTGTSPIYDDISLHRPRPNRFTLSNYGHLQIDYSCNWNNLNKYIYN